MALLKIIDTGDFRRKSKMSLRLAGVFENNSKIRKITIGALTPVPKDNVEIGLAFDAAIRSARYVSK